MFCSQCGTKNDDSAKFCSSCGTAFAAAASSPTRNHATPNVATNAVSRHALLFHAKADFNQVVIRAFMTVAILVAIILVISVPTVLFAGFVGTTTGVGSATIIVIVGGPVIIIGMIMNMYRSYTLYEDEFSTTGPMSHRIPLTTVVRVSMKDSFFPTLLIETTSQGEVKILGMSKDDSLKMLESFEIRIAQLKKMSGENIVAAAHGLENEDVEATLRRNTQATQSAALPDVVAAVTSPTRNQATPNVAPLSLREYLPSIAIFILLAVCATWLLKFLNNS